MSVLDLQDLAVERDATAENAWGGSSDLSVVLCGAGLDAVAPALPLLANPTSGG